jgi:hypothetical protein
MDMNVSTNLERELDDGSYLEPKPWHKCEDESKDEHEGINL